MANRPGFIVPNAADVGGNFRISEVDAVDWLSLGNHRYGIVSGCVVELPAEDAVTATITGGDDGNVIKVDGQLIFMPDGSVPLLQGNSSRDRFDLIIFDSIARAFRVLEGSPSANPTFPDLLATHVLLAAVFVPAGATTISRSFVTDKRVLLARNFQGSVGASQRLLENLLPDGSSPIYVLGTGQVVWGNDVSLRRTDPQTLTVEGFLTVDRALRAKQGAIVTGAVSASGKLTGSNLRSGYDTPLSTEGTLGDLYTRERDGALLQKKSYGWVEFYADDYPPGIIISSMLLPSNPYMDGWLPMQGQTFPRSAVGRLWDLDEFAAWRNDMTQTMTLPDATNSVLMQDIANAALVTGSMARTLAANQMPRHSHFGSSASTESSGQHTHIASTNPAGGHGHNVSGGSHDHAVGDPGHTHPAPYGAGGFLVSSLVDSSQPNRVYIPEPPNQTRGLVWPETGARATGISVSGGPHSHSVSSAPDHTHEVVFQTGGGHTHGITGETPAGGDQPIDITPAHLGVRFYIKV